jgi:hypothetical protein
VILIHTTVSRTASTWVESILLAVGEELGLRVEPRGPDAYRERVAGPGLADGSIHPAVFLRWDELALERCPHPWRVFHVRRDPRDGLISSYFAHLYSHSTTTEIEQRLPILRALSKEEGLIWLMAEAVPNRVEVLMSHLGRGRADGCLAVDFADLVSRPHRHLRRMLAFAGWHLPWRVLRGLVAARSFERHSGGRRPGDEDVHHHYRKGVPGDWKLHFTPRVAEAFKAGFGKELVELGYERSLDW